MGTGLYLKQQKLQYNPKLIQKKLLKKLGKSVGKLQKNVLTNK